jgi:hypothetical protein
VPLNHSPAAEDLIKVTLEDWTAGLTRIYSDHTDARSQVNDTFSAEYSTGSTPDRRGTAVALLCVLPATAVSRYRAIAMTCIPRPALADAPATGSRQDRGPGRLL